MKNKKKLIILISVISLVLIIVLAKFIINFQNDGFSIKEKEWIEENKNKVIDITILNDIPIITYNGEGILFSFLDDFEKELGLTFNKTAYKIDDNVEGSYIFKLVDKAEENDILIMQDNYVLVLKDQQVYNNIDDIKNLKIGVLNNDIESFNNYLDDSNVLTGYDTVSGLIEGFSSNSENVENSVDGMIILKSLIMKQLVENNLTISYQFNNYTKDYVLSMNGDELLNNIIKKQYNKWYEENYDNEYNNYLLEQYYTFKKVSDSEQTELKSKSYTYGFIENGIFDSLSGSNLKGINNLVLKSFTNFSGISLSYKKYDSINDLINAFNKNKVDIFLDITNNTEYDIDIKTTKSNINSPLVVASKTDNNIVVDSLYALQDKNVVIVDGSNIESYLNSYNIKYNKYKSVKEILNNVSKTDIIIIDMENYDYYKNSELKDYKIDYIVNDNHYSYVVNNSNTVLSDLFDFYTNYTSMKQIISNGYEDISYKVVDYFYILIIIIILLVIALGLLMVNKVKRLIIDNKKKRKFNLSKIDKLKYVDQLTSLKNRAYLNSKVDEWDNSEVYPQAIIIVDLNNIAYVNDNYGREEGDKVIVEAANILINSQLKNSEIIRTDGNEFLIYLVGYNEKNVISYLRSLSRELKRLSHGFGAASGYSMITDGIKTVDDAVNEATIDMRTNKEDIDY